MAWNNDKIRDLVIRTIVGEAARNDRDSEISVAHVLKNRADTGHYGDRSIDGLTKTITAHNNAGQYQFSMWHPSVSSSGKTISPSDPYYQRVGAIADAVFNGEIPDNTGGADHYYAPSGMPGGRAPSWAIGQTPTATIGGQHFFKLGLGASDAPNFGHTSAPAIGASAPAPAPAATPITPIQSFTGGDYGRQATADKQPFSGIVIHVTGKPDLQSELTYNRTPDAGRGNAYYGYHYIVDRDGKVYQTAPDDVRTNHIMGNKEHGLSNENAIGVAFVGGAPAGKNPLPMTPEQMAAGKALVDQLKAKYNIDPTKIVGHGELDPSRIKGLNPDGGAEGAEFLTAYRGDATPAGFKLSPEAMSTPVSTVTGQPVSASPNVPAPQAQPVAATAPPGSPPTPGSSQNPPAGFVGPGSDKYSVLQRMPTGTGRNPELITAANWGNLFGGASPVASPAAPAATPAPAAQPGPAYGPPLPPVTTPPNAPVNESPGSIMSSILPNWGATTGDYDPAEHPGWAPNPHLKGALGALATTAGQPTMGFPAMTNPFGQPPPPAQTSSLPGSMFASAQNLLKLLYPTG